MNQEVEKETLIYQVAALGENVVEEGEVVVVVVVLLYLETTQEW